MIKTFIPALILTHSIMGPLPIYAQEQNMDLDLFIESVMDIRQIPGLQLAVIKDQEVIKLSSYGLADLEQEKPVTNDTVFPINSMTKAFTGTLIVRLIADGKVELTDEIGKHLKDLPPEWHSLTIFQLLSHTSALPEILSGNLAELIGNGTDENAWQEVKRQPLNGQPGERFRYNQTGYAILGKLIEKYEDTSFVEAVNHIFTEGGMVDTLQYSFYKEQGLNSAAQYLYSSGNHLPTELEFAKIIWPAAGASSSARELAQYVITLQQGKYFDLEHLESLWSPYRLNNGGTEGFSELENGYASGWQVISRQEHPAVSASGGDHSTIIIYPDEDLSIIVVTNLYGSLPIQFVDEVAQYYR